MALQSTSELSFVIRDVGLGMTILESFANGTPSGGYPGPGE